MSLESASPLQLLSAELTLPMSAPVSAPVRFLLSRLRGEGGFGMVELLAAMTILVVGLIAVFGLFQSGILAIKRAGTVTTAAVLAESEMETFRALKYEALGLSNADVDAADAVYKGDAAYTDVSLAATTLAADLTAAATSLTVASSAGFPAGNGFRVKIDSEVVLVTAGAGTSTWTVTRGVNATLPSDHLAGAAVTVIQRVNVAKCGTAPCTDLVPTKLVTGADGRTYRLDTYATWTGVKNEGGTDGRAVKLLTVVVRANTAPYTTWARVASTFDESTGL